MNTHAATWDRAIAGTESRQGPISPTAAAPAAHDIDPLSGLPEKAREKFQDLEDKLADARTLARDSDFNALLRAKIQAADRVAELTDPATSQRSGYGNTFPSSHPSVQDAEARLAKSTKELERAQSRAATRQLLTQQLGQLLNACERYIQQMRGQPLDAFTGMAPKLRRGETHSKAIEKIHEARLVLEADLNAVESAPRTAKDTKAIAREEIEALASRGAPDVFSMLGRGASEIGWPKRSDKIDIEAITPSLTQNGDGFKQVYGQGVAYNETPDSLALVAWLFKDALLARVDSEIDGVADDKTALTIEQRAEREASIRAAILDAEHAEAWHIDQATSQGTDIPPRPDMDPRAFLNVTGPALRDW